MDVLLNKEPVEVLGDGGDVLPGASMNKETGSRVLDVFLYWSRVKTKEKVVAASLEVMKAVINISAVLWEEDVMLLR